MAEPGSAGRHPEFGGKTIPTSDASPADNGAAAAGNPVIGAAADDVDLFSTYEASTTAITVDDLSNDPDVSILAPREQAH